MSLQVRRIAFQRRPRRVVKDWRVGVTLTDGASTVGGRSKKCGIITYNVAVKPLRVVKINVQIILHLQSVLSDKSFDGRDITAGRIFSTIKKISFIFIKHFIVLKLLPTYHHAIVS